MEKTPLEPKKRSNLEAIVQANSPYHVQNWYPWLKDHTFATIFLPLPVELAQAITSYKDKTVTADAEKSLTRKFAPKIPESVRSSLETKLARIANLIDNAKAELTQNTDSGLFVRLSSRSPKDLISVRLYDAYLAEMQREMSRNSSAAENALWQKIVFTRASGLALRVSDGQEAVSLLVNSQRVYEDLAMSLKLHQPNRDDSTDSSHQQEWTQELVVRKWENIQQEWEFRAFVYGGKLTACTQYNVGLYVPLLVEKRLETAQRVQNFWSQTIHPLLEQHIQTYVVDFAVDPHSDKIWVVEINNPPPVAGTALFDWENSADRAIIENGPFEFRIMDKIPEDPMKNQRDWLKSMEARQARATAQASTKKQKNRLSF
jgi:hypothetical protein